MSKKPKSGKGERQAEPVRPTPWYTAETIARLLHHDFVGAILRRMVRDNVSPAELSARSGVPIEAVESVLGGSLEFGVDDIARLGGALGMFFVFVDDREYEALKRKAK